MINEDIAQEIMHQLFSSLEALETQCAAMLQLLKDKRVASEEELAAHLEQAGSASSVRWRAVRVRIDHLLSSATKATEQESAKPEPAKFSDNHQEPPVTTGKTTSMKEGVEASSGGEPEKDTQASEKVAGSDKSEAKQDGQVNASAGNRNQENDRTSRSAERAAKGNQGEGAPDRKTA